MYNTKKRNARGNGSIRQRENGTWEALCTINGVRRSFYGDKQSDALKAYESGTKISRRRRIF